MQMTFRWYGDGNDDITPEMIRQIPGVSGLVWALHDNLDCRGNRESKS